MARHQSCQYYSPPLCMPEQLHRANSFAELLGDTRPRRHSQQPSGVRFERTPCSVLENCWLCHQQHAPSSRRSVASAAQSSRTLQCRGDESYSDRRTWKHIMSTQDSHQSSFRPYICDCHTTGTLSVHLFHLALLLRPLRDHSGTTGSQCRPITDRHTAGRTTDGNRIQWPRVVFLGDRGSCSMGSLIHGHQ